MPRAFTVLSESDLERELLRKGVGALEACRPTCEDCGRTPLVGERIFRYRRGVVVCALCAPTRDAEPEATDMVRHSERGHAVRRVLRHAA
jgi:uncharacterized Zn finger protein (UPF0148 family)